MTKGFMAMGQWRAMSAEEQAEYLKVTRQAVRGYTLVGASSQPSHVEFEKDYADPECPFCQPGWPCPEHLCQGIK